MKKFRELADETATRICATLDVEPTAAQRAAIIEMIEQQLVDNAIETRHWCADHATNRSAIGSEAGRELAEELHREHDALMANLKSLR